MIEILRYLDSRSGGGFGLVVENGGVALQPCLVSFLAFRNFASEVAAMAAFASLPCPIMVLATCPQCSSSITVLLPFVSQGRRRAPNGFF